MLQQNTNEWLDFRRDKIGASDAPVIMGESSWSTPYRRWMEKLGLQSGQTVNAGMKWGTEQEPIIRKMFMDEAGIQVSPEVLIHKDIPWMIASMDGVSHDKKIGVEIKCAGAEDQATASKRKVPKKYYAQLQHQLEVGRFEALYYASLGSDGSFVWFEVRRDDVYISRMLEKEHEFYDCIRNFESPPLCDRDHDYRDDHCFQRAAAQWLEVKERLDSVKEEEEQIRQCLITLADGRSVVGSGIKVSKSIRKGAVRYKDIPQLQEIDVNPYRAPSITTWTIKQTDKREKILD